MKIVHLTAVPYDVPLPSGAFRLPAMGEVGGLSEADVAALRNDPFIAALEITGDVRFEAEAVEPEPEQEQGEEPEPIPAPWEAPADEG